MPNFIFEANIDYYKQLLAVEIDAKKQTIIRMLLEKEEAKLRMWMVQNQSHTAVEEGRSVSVIS